jgi:hypothetical protein
MWKEMKDRTISLKEIKICLKLYLSFECWVNEPHPPSQVHQSLKALGILINLIKECFPRDEGWGWNLPKMYAISKMPHNMLKFGSVNNFSGNIREWAWLGIPIFSSDSWDPHRKWNSNTVSDSVNSCQIFF